MLVGCEGQYCTHFLSYLLGFSNTVSLKAKAEKRCSYPMNLMSVYSSVFAFPKQPEERGMSCRHDQLNSTVPTVLPLNWKTQPKRFSRTSNCTLTGATPEG